ncbi:MAG: type II toxin-antitoxin system VapC family toxin [Rhodoferax sp.]|uniref:type II toxin-antitoxin system tRNA(fMet)-specific endonuclease VapC n=1 Tax=Rhodoferax sp. TaxID=50421 RepID=UPI003BB77869|nr:type II toxin-antitoxin system VapC family toxin [Rhodoferax sp.]
MKYLLDTNICIYAINQRSDQLVQRLQAAGPAHLATSALVAAELAFGVEKSKRPDTKEKLMLFLSGLHVLPWTDAAIWHYAKHRRSLQEAGTPIGDMNLLIASHALAEDFTLVTNNTREFERVEGLIVENWAA